MIKYYQMYVISMVHPGAHLEEADLFIKGEVGGIRLTGDSHDVRRYPNDQTTPPYHNSLVRLTRGESLLVTIVELYVRSPNVLRRHPEVFNLTIS